MLWAVRRLLASTFTAKSDMIDLIYVLGTIAFFALMLAYVRGCEVLGRTTSTDVEHTQVENP